MPPCLWLLLLLGDLCSITTTHDTTGDNGAANDEAEDADHHEAEHDVVGEVGDGELHVLHELIQIVTAY